MAATRIVSDQIKKATTFIYILILLFIINIIFNLKFKWDVIPIIVNVYLFVFSFYLIFNFSLIDIPPLKEEYKKIYPRFGHTILFIKTRIIPFIIIYVTTAIYTLINYLDKDHWPWNPIMELLDGRFHHTVFYSLILLIMLKFNRKPRITIFLFVAGAAIYFLIYQLVYYFSPSGAVMSWLKFLQIAVALILLIYEFISDKITIDKRRIFKSVAVGILMGMVGYSSFVGPTFMVYHFSSFASYQQGRAAQILMRLGYSSPLKNFKQIVIETSDPYLLYDLIYYSRAYNRPFSLTSAEWENLILSGSMEVANVIAFYVTSLNVTLSYQQILSYAERRSVDSGESLINSSFYTRYASRYCGNHMDDMIKQYEKGNKYFKLWVIRVTAESKCYAAIPFLIRLLTDTDPLHSQEAYMSLSKITGLDPAKESDNRINTSRVAIAFSEFYRNSRKTH